MKPFCKSGMIIVIIPLIGFIFPIYGQDEFRITTNPEAQSNPAIYGNIVVWEDRRDIGKMIDIYGYDISKEEEFPITTAQLSQKNPAIYGDIVVWEDYRNIQADIYGYNLSTSQEFPVITESYFQKNPAIYGDIVVWEDGRHLYNEIYGYNLSTREEFRITRDEWNQSDPSIYKDVVVWEDYRNGNGDIYGYNLSTREEFRITTNPYNQINPAIYGDFVVWEDYRNDYSDIYGYDLSTKKEFPITTARSNQINPAIYKYVVIWSDRRNISSPFTTDIYGYNLLTSQEYLIKENVNCSWDKEVEIYGNIVIWEDDRDRDNADIYGYDISRVPMFGVKVNVKDSEENSISGATVVLDEYPPELTDEDGVAIIRNLRTGNYALKVSAADYEENIQTIIIVENQIVDVTLARALTVTIIVQNSTGDAIAKSAVIMIGSTIYSETTDVTGKVTISNVIRGSYTLIVSHPEYETFTDSDFEVASSINITLALTKRVGPPSISPSPSIAESENKLKSRNGFEKFVSWLEDLPFIRLIVVLGAMIAIPAALITIMIYFAGSKRT